MVACTHSFHHSMCRSVPPMPVRRTRISTSPGPGCGSGTSRSHSPGRASALTRAFKSPEPSHALGGGRPASGGEAVEPVFHRRHLLLEAAYRRRPGEVAPRLRVVVLMRFADDIDSV